MFDLRVKILPPLLTNAADWSTGAAVVVVAGR